MFDRSARSAHQSSDGTLMRCPLTPKKEGATSSRECSLQKRRGCICECGLLSAALCWESALSVPL
eukprot:5533000-Pyramimonas_sp.AAC.1